MTKQTTQLAITACLIVALLFIVANNLKKKSLPGKRAAAQGAATQTVPAAYQAPAVASPAADDAKILAQRERAALAWGRDVFSQATDKEYQRSDLSLKGISFGADQTGFAFINDDIVKVGDKVGDYEILEIHKDKVLVGKGTQNFYLTLSQE